MKTWVCSVCGWVYDEAKGDPDYDLAPGVAFDDLPDDFVCPLCGVDQSMFELQEERKGSTDDTAPRKRGFYLCEKNLR